MGVHGNDVVEAIRAALRGELDHPFLLSAQAPTQSETRWTPNPEQEWQNRDGKIEFDCIGKDWFRAFRVTVESLPSVENFEGEI